MPAPQTARNRIALAVALCLALAGSLAPTGATARVASPPPCRAADLDMAVAHGGISERTVLNLAITTVDPATTCALGGPLTLAVRDATGVRLVAAPLPDANPVVLSAGGGAGLTAEWGNWCAPDSTPGTRAPVNGPLTVELAFAGDRAVVVGHPRGTAAEDGPLGGGPLCTAPDQPSTLTLHALAASPGGSLGPAGGPSFYVAAPFLAYWRQHGGLAILGHPLGREMMEQLADGKTYTVQYFERARLEYHPENAAPNDVQLGQLGRALHPADPPVPAQRDGLAFYFPETGHNVDKRFLGFWQRNGGLAQFGYPLGEPFDETLADGKAYRVQYFERARFEYHPESAAPYDVQLGQVGLLHRAGGGR